MKIVVTGGTGFLGQLLIRALLERGRLSRADGTESGIEQIVSVDQAQPGRLIVDDRVGYVVGDIGAPHFLSHVLAADTDSVFHLAAVVSGAAEADFDLGMRVNLDGTRALLDACRVQKRTPRVVFASSVAVFGGPLPAVVTDETTPTPQSSYGVQKLVGELLVGDYSRKGFVDGRAVRLPTIVVRPGKPNAAASSFASGIIREPLAGETAICPVEPDTAMWLLSPDAAIRNLVHAHELPADAWGSQRALNLPGLTLTVREMIEALRAVGGDAAVERIQWQPDERIRAIVRTWPARFDTRRADALGFVRDADFVEVVRAYARTYAGG
ncbi:SDR family oxidoreductase [Betaproteobacteria bacterium PRO7]|nr:SDR family oxidoreductase [Betaproteobacteria bacterium PRO7]